MDPLESDRLGSFPHPREVYRLFGHDDAVATLNQALSQDRFPHAWLITGPKGIGKATFAYQIARTLLAGQAALGTVGPDHPVARRIEALGHTDLLLLRRPWDDKAGRLKRDITVDEVRRTNSFFGSHAGEGGWRVCVVDCVDELNGNAANALLKILEEPPERSVFLMVCHNAGRTLPTIRSRCRMLKLGNLAPEVIAQALADAFPDLSTDGQQTIATLAEGSIGYAYQLAAEDGLPLYQELTEMVAGLPQVDTLRVMDLGDRLSRPAAEQSYHLMSDLLISLLERLIKRAATGGSATFSTDPEKRAYTHVAGTGSLDDWLLVWENLRRLFARADAVSLDKRQVILSAFNQLGSVGAGAVRPLAF